MDDDARRQLRAALNADGDHHNSAAKLRISEVLGTFLRAYDCVRTSGVVDAAALPLEPE
jgi:hypothetical protein